MTSRIALQTDAETLYQSFDQVVALIREKRDMKLLVEVESHLRLARYAPGRIEFEPTRDAAPDLAANLSGIGGKEGLERGALIRKIKDGDILVRDIDVLQQDRQTVE